MPKKVIAQNAHRSRNPTRPPLVSKPPKSKRKKDPVIKMMAKDMLDPAAKEWLHQLTTVFERETEVGMPLFEDNWPCPTSIVTNYGDRELVVPESTDTLNMWFYPNGTYAEDSVSSGHLSVLANTAEGLYVIGPNVRAHASAGSSPGLFQWGAATSNTGSPTMSTCNAFKYENLTTLGVQQSDQTGFRTAAFAVRVTFVSRLDSTEGWVEHIAPYETPPSATSFASLRRDRSYRRQFFDSQRTHTFYWQPTCEDVRFSSNIGSVVTGTQPSRFCLSLGSVGPGDKFLVEFISIQEYVGHAAVPTQVPRMMSPDATHVLNTLVAGHGYINRESESTKKAQHSLWDMSAIHKIMAHPLAKKALGYAGSTLAALKDKGKLAGLASRILTLTMG